MDFPLSVPYNRHRYGVLTEEELLIKMNILLVYPRYPDTFWSFKHVLRFISRKAAFPPLGLLTVGAMLPEDWNKKLIDVNVYEACDVEGSGRLLFPVQAM